MALQRSRKKTSRIKPPAKAKAKRSSRPAPNPQKALQARKQKIGAYVQELFSQKWIQDVIAELAERQPKSMERMTALREIEVTSPGFWPYFAFVLPLCLERAEGGKIYDVDGNEYLDFFLGFGSQSLHGHNAEPVVRNVKKLLGKSVGNGYCSSLELEYVRLLKEFNPHCEKFAFQNSGSDATSAAIRLARAYSGRRLVVRFEGTANGQYDVTSYNAHPPLHGNPLIPFAPRKGGEVQLQSFNRGAQVLGKEDLLILPFNEPGALDIIKKRKNEIACVMVEPIPQYFPVAEVALPFTRELSELCRKTGVLLIFDEIHTGFRYGPSGVTGHENLHADLITYGKVISALGIPMSAIGGRADILNQALTSGNSIQDYGQRTFLATTHINNHLAIAASYASLSLLKEKGPAYYERTRQKAQRMRAKINALDVGPDMSVGLNGVGEFFGSIGFASKDLHKARNVKEFVEASNPIPGVILALLLRRKGLYFHGSTFLYTGDAHTEQQLDEATDKIVEGIQEMKRNGFSFSPPV
jgi:glutamate-1-semialdehyde 2,1-aminomutase